jgi:hypothetical protein
MGAVSGTLVIAFIQLSPFSAKEVVVVAGFDPFNGFSIGRCWRVSLHNQKSFNFDLGFPFIVNQMKVWKPVVVGIHAKFATAKLLQTRHFM